MSYSKITLDVPETAQPYEEVPVVVVIENISTIPEPHTIEVTPVVRINGIVLEGSTKFLPPEGTDKSQTWYFSFTMPQYSVAVSAESWVESYYTEFHLDKTAQGNVYLPGEVPKGFPWSWVIAGSTILATIAMFSKRKR